MIETLDLLSIHEYDIDVTMTRIQDVFEELGIDLDDVEEQTMDYLIGEPIQEDLGNQIINALLHAAGAILLEKIAPFKPELGLYVNGADSHFYISDNDKSIIKAVTQYGLEYDLVIWMREQFPEDDDFDYFVKTESYHDAIRNLKEAGANLVWSYPEEEGLTEAKAEDRENEFLADPGDTEKAFLISPLWKCFTVQDEGRSL